MIAHDEQQHDEKLHQFVHDIKHCLHVVGMVTEILKQVREDDAKFAEFCELMGREHKKAIKVLNDYLNTTL